jgi:AcrR family transcriptional regulator
MWRNAVPSWRQTRHALTLRAVLIKLTTQPEHETWSIMSRKRVSTSKPAKTGEEWLSQGRIEQKLRTRKVLLDTASKMLAEGKTPTIADVARVARISRATAYRYFPTNEALVAEAPLEIGIPTPRDVFGPDGLQSKDVEERVDEVERMVHKVVCDTEPSVRMFLKTSMDQWFAQEKKGAGIPLRQGRRMELIDAALEPAAGKMGSAEYRTLRAALAIIIGIESFIALADVARLSPSEALNVKRWAARALVREGLKGIKRKTK